jgi:hypothetical protein
MRLSQEARRVLLSLNAGALLKSHRSLDGAKDFQVHPLDSAPVHVRQAIVDALLRDGLVTSNQKFPAATYLLTDRGREVAIALADHTDL